MRKITLLILMLFSLTVFGQPTTAAPTPTQDQTNVISIFSDTYTNVGVSEFSTTWDAADVTDVMAAGNPVKAYALSGDSFIGIQLSELNNLNNFTNFHVDIWVDNIDAGDVILPKLANFANGTGSAASNEIEFTYAFAPTDGGTWISIDTELSNFNVVSGGSNSLGELFQIVFGSSATLAGATVYMDNLYFWKPAVDINTDATLSDLTIDGNTVSGFGSNTFTYDVELPVGTTMVPVVAGVASQAGVGSSNVSVNDAASLPGSTVVTVTAPDGSTTETYTLNFTVELAGPTEAAPTPPNRAPENVLSIFSDAYTDISVSEFSTTWDNADVSDGMAGGDPVKIYDLSGGAFIGIQLSSTNDLTSFTHFHVDIWVDNIDAGDVLLPKLANFANGTGSPASNEIEFTYAFAPTDGGTWISIDTELSNFNVVSGGSNSLGELFQIVFGSSATLAGAKMYLDNLYFHNNVVLSNESFNTTTFKVYPNPANSVWNITSNQDMETITVFNILGKEVLTINPNSDKVTLDASSLKSGVYFAQIKNINGMETIRIVRE